MKFKIGDEVMVNHVLYQNEYMGCCHDCDGTSHYLEVDKFVIDSISNGWAFYAGGELGYDLEHLVKQTKLDKVLK